MAYCRSCGHEIDDSAVFCQYCGASQSSASNSAAKDKKSFWWWLLGFIFPLVGLILYIVWKKDTPKRASSAGSGALVSVILSLVLTVATVLLASKSEGSLTDAVNDTKMTAEEVSELDDKPVIENTDTRFTYRADGKIDTFTDNDTVWTYEYDSTGAFTRRVGLIAYPDWDYGESQKFAGTTTDLTVSPAVFSEKYDNCIGFSVSYLMTDATGTPGGLAYVYVKEPPETTYVKEAEVNIVVDEPLEVILDFSKPKTVEAVALRPVHGVGSWSSRMGIYDLKIVDYNCVTE